MGRRVGRLGAAVLLVVVAAGGAGALSRGAWPLTLVPPVSPIPVVPPALLGPLASSGGLWVPTFDDEFDGTGVDASKWSNGFGWGDTAANFAAWCDPSANTVVDGALVQRADRLPVSQNGKAYRGACLHTREKFSQL